MQIEASVEHWARDDREAEGLRVAALDELSRPGADHLAGMSPSAIHTSVRYIRDGAWTGYKSGPDYQAWRAFADLRRDEETSLGRQLTATEEDTLAERVRMSQPPGRRGKIGFHRAGVPVTISLYGDDGWGPADSLEAAEPWAADESPLDGVDDEEISSLAREIGRWQTYARYTGAPAAAARTLTESRAASYRALVRGASGAREVATDYLNRRVLSGDEVVEALFRPFGDLPEGQRRSLAAQLARLPRAAKAGGKDPAHMLWDDAVRVATRVKPRRSNGGLA